MAEWSKLEVVRTLREAMAKRSVKLTDLARLTDVPYRSLQNYFSGKTEMPVSVYLKICENLGLDPLYVKNESFVLEYYSLRNALVDTLGNLLPTLKKGEGSSWDLVPYTGEPRTKHELWKDAAPVASLIAMAYDRDRERELHKSLSDDDEADGSSMGSPIKEGNGEGS